MAVAVDSTRYKDLCRLCATRTNMVNGISIFDSEGAARQIYKKIETCLPVQIHECDELPKMVCENCLYKIELLFEFRERTLRTESLLVDLFKELNTMQLHEHMNKMEVEAQLAAATTSTQHHPVVMVQHQASFLNDPHNLQNVNELELSQLAQREMVGHEIIMAHQNVSLDNIELSGHELNQELSNHSIQGQNGMLVGNGHLPGGRYVEGMEYHQEHQMLAEQYVLGEIGLAEPSLQTQETTEPNVQNNRLIEEQSSNSDSQDIKYGELHVEMNNLKEDSNSQNRLLIDENNKESYLLPNDNHFGLPENESLLYKQLSEKDWFCCNMCGDTFRDKFAFKDHCDQHNNKSRPGPAEFDDKEELNAHRKEVHGSSSNPGNNVRLKDDMVISNTGYNKKDKPDISADPEDEPDEDETDSSKTSDNGGKKKKWSPKVCPVCKKSYKTNYKLNEHLRSHTGEQPFKCNSCDKAFRSKIGLAQHEAKHTGQYNYSCSTCGKGFQCKSYLMVHQRVHSDVKPYPCTVCNRNFKTKQSLLDHTNRHLGVKPYTCETCGRSFITNGLCKAHQKVHSGMDNRKYSCKVCNKMFVSKSYLQTHLRIHTGEKPFMCEVCGKGFLTRVDLKIHSTMHTGEKSYVCEICGKAFARRDALRCHRRSHTGERPYSCDICGQTFTQFSPMAIHKRLHTGERPYECTTCGKKFVSRSTMMVHSKKHGDFVRDVRIFKTDDAM